MMLRPAIRENAAIQHLISEEQKKLTDLTDEYLKKLASGEITYGADNSDVQVIDTIARIKGLRLLSKRLGLTGDAANIKPRTLRRLYKRLAREIAYWTADAKDISEETGDVYWTECYCYLEEARKLIFKLLEQSSKKSSYQTLTILEDKMPSWNELASDEASRS